MAGIGSVLAKYQGGTPAYCFDEGTYRQFGGKFIDWNGGNKFSRIVTKKRFLKELKNYDVWHYHYPYPGLKETLQESKGDRKYLKHYHGDDLRGKHEDDFCVVSTPDLLQFAPNGVWLPSPIDLQEISSIKVTENNDKVRIAHYPHYKHYQSTDYYSAVLDSFGDNVEVVRIFGKPHREALEIIATCDIVIGKIMPQMGWFSLFELEGMALGKPVTAYVSDELYEKYRPPVHRVTAETFADDLKSLVDDAQERKRLGQAGKAYVEQNHDARKIVEAVAGYYNKV